MFTIRRQGNRSPGDPRIGESSSMLFCESTLSTEPQWSSFTHTNRHRYVEVVEGQRTT